MDPNVIVVLAVAVLGSSAVTRVVDRYFLRKNDEAIVGKTKAEAADILSQAADRTLKMMEASMRAAQVRIEQLEHRVAELETTVFEYHRLHGPLSDLKDDH